MPHFPFTPNDRQQGKRIIQEKGIQNLLFSEGTYQVEVLDPASQKRFWPFLQLDDQGKILDHFCTCNEVEKEGSCPHLAAAYLEIFRGFDEPLHVRFRASLWNHIFQIAARRHGYEESALQKWKESGYACLSEKGRPLFYILPKTGKAQKELEEMIFHRVEETEESSLKFSKLPPEELALWKEGRPSQQLQFELSFWSDIAKHLMLAQDVGRQYEISFQGKIGDLPKGILASFSEFEIGIFLTEVNWPEVIPSLKTVRSPIPVRDFQTFEIDSILYDEEDKILKIISHPIQIEGKKIHDPSELPGKTFLLHDFAYHPKLGFYPAHIDPLLKKKEIKGDAITTLLNRHPKLIQAHLKNISLHYKPHPVSYTLFFDKKDHLHIKPYLFEPGDFEKERSFIAFPWAYLQGRGFYLLDEFLFEELEHTIPKEKIGDFIDHYRRFLNQQDGFEIHISSIESQVLYHVDPEEFLSFETQASFDGDANEIIDLNDWIYIKERGFYPKMTRSLTSIFSSEIKVPAEEIPNFIKQHKEELEGIKDFFSEISPIEKAGLRVSYDKKKGVLIEPEFIKIKSYGNKDVHFFGEYAFVRGEGFSEVPSRWKLPDKYRQKRWLDASSEAYFVAYELDKLRPFIFELDSQLERPIQLQLKIDDIIQEENRHYRLKLSYRSEHGILKLSDLKAAMDSGNSYFISDAGLIFFKDPRFQWLKKLTLDEFDQDKLILSTLNWMRLCVFESPIPPEEGTRAFEIYTELKTFQTSDILDTSGLKSDLRPYQQIGVEWLWFLYCHGLSGLLCDEMGLGKTHQAMALLAALLNHNKKAKYLIVCPTSVIYHWEELLKNFLPKASVLVFYGIQRSLANFEKKYDVLLTSYGTLRSEKKALSKRSFELVIYDEIQYAKNSRSQTHQALKAMQSKMRLGLTGTPIENRLMELKALFDIVLPTYFPSTAAYREQFINPIEKEQSEEKKSLLTRLIQPFLLRRKKSEVLDDLPEKIEEISYCDLSEEQENLYKEAVSRSRPALIDEIEKTNQPIPYFHIFSLINQLKRICDHPSLIYKDLDRFSKHRCGKWDLFVELLHEARESQQKIVIFSQYLDMLDIIENYLTQEKIGFAAIRGSTRNRKEQLIKFREDPTCEIFVASLKAVGVGVDLVAGSVVIHYDRWWNPAKENQATDRVHRIGQNRGVQVFKLVTKGTIEERINFLIEKKTGLAEGIIDCDDQNQLKLLDREELLELVKNLL